MFDTYRAVPVSGARREFKSLLHDVAFRQKRVLLTHHKSPMVAVVPMHDMETLEEVDRQKREKATKEAGKHRFFSSDERLPADAILLESEDDDEKLVDQGVGEAGPDDMSAVNEMLATIEGSDPEGKSEARAACLRTLSRELHEAINLSNTMTEFLRTHGRERYRPEMFEQQAKNGLTLQRHLHSIWLCYSKL